MLKRSVSPSMTKSSRAAIVYGLSHVPHTIPRNLSPTFLMMKNCFGAPTPNPNHTPMTSFSVNRDFHGPGWMYGRPSAPSGFRRAGFAGTGGPFGRTDTIAGMGSGPRGSL